MIDGAEKFWELKEAAQAESRTLIHPELKLTLIPWWQSNGGGKSGRDFFIWEGYLGVAPSILQWVAPDVDEAYWYVTRHPGWCLGEKWTPKIVELIKNTCWSISEGDGGIEKVEL